MSATIQCLLSRFLSRVVHHRGIYWQDFWAELMESRLVCRSSRVSFDHCSERYYWSFQGHSDPPFIWCLPIRQEILNVFADGSNIPWNPPTIRHPDRTAIAQQMSLLSLCALLFRQSHLFLICVVVTYNDPR